VLFAYLAVDINRKIVQSLLLFNVDTCSLKAMKLLHSVHLFL
jgi:hypothetical protein